MNAKIAIPYSDGQIFQHLGKATQFKIYTLEDDKVTASEVADTEGTGHEELALWLVWHGVHGVICGNIGAGMQGALTGAGIAFMAGIDGSADEAIEKLIARTLVGTTNANCGCGGHSDGGCGGCGGHSDGGCGGGCGGCHH